MGPFRRFRIRRRRSLILLPLLLLVIVWLAFRSCARAADEFHVSAGFDIKHAYQPASKGYPVSHKDLTLHDASRDKDLELRVYFPQLPASSTAKLPLIIFSHGLGGSRDVGPTLLGYWASHGYVVVAPTHADSLKKRWENGEAVGFKSSLQEFGTDPGKRMGRVRDDRFVISSIAGLEKAIPAISGRIDAEHIGVGGHSAGAMTAVLIGGALMDMPVNGPGGPETADQRDPRVDCILVLSGQGLGGAIDKHTWDPISIPMMVMTGTLDDSKMTGQTADARQDPYRYAQPGDKYLLYIEGAAHMSFTGKAAGEEGSGRGRMLNAALGADEALLDAVDDFDQLAIFNAVQSSSLAFWDAYLRNSQTAKEYLESGAPGKLKTPGIEYSHK